jgi:hypothetical protein
MTPLILKTIVMPLAAALMIAGAVCIPLRHHSLAWHRRRRSILRALTAGILHR